MAASRAGRPVAAWASRACLTATVCWGGSSNAQRAAPVSSTAVAAIRRQGGLGALSTHSIYSVWGRRCRRRLRVLVEDVGAAAGCNGTSWWAHLRQNLAESRFSAPHLEQVSGMQRWRV